MVHIGYCIGKAWWNKGITSEALNVDDIVETAHHFKCIDMVIEQSSRMLPQSFIKQLHLTTKTIIEENGKRNDKQKSS